MGCLSYINADDGARDNKVYPLRSGSTGRSSSAILDSMDGKIRQMLDVDGERSDLFSARSEGNDTDEQFAEGARDRVKGGRYDSSSSHPLSSPPAAPAGPL